MHVWDGYKTCAKKAVAGCISATDHRSVNRCFSSRNSQR